MTTLIMGRTGAGKDALRKILEKDFGWKFLQSYTTRPQRSEEDASSHIFVTPSQARAIGDRAAYTEINGYEYFSTFAQLDESDGYIIDPDGVRVLLANCPDRYFRILYMFPGSEETRRNLSIQRADDPENEARVFGARAKSESAQFDDFEKKLQSGERAFDGANYAVGQFVNTYEEKDLRALAEDLDGKRRFAANAAKALMDLMEADVMKHTDDMQPLMADSAGTTEPVPVDILCGYLALREELLGGMMRDWLSLPGTNLTGGRT